MSLERNCHNNQKSTWLLKNDQLFSTLSSSSQVTVGGSHNNRDLQLTDIINTLFSVGQDKIQLADFLKLMYKREKHRTDTNWMDAFRVYDPDGTGIIR